MQKKNTFHPLKPKAICRPGKLYNAEYFAEYCELVTLLASVSWDINPDYHELQ